MRVMRVYHGGRIPSHRARDRALAAAGHEVVLVVPRSWPGEGGEEILSPERFAIVELDVSRPGDVNKHRYLADVAALVAEHEPDVLDLHAEPYSAAAHQWLKAVAPDLPVVMYTAQNVDKRYPPPYAGYERAALERVSAMWPCSRQAASVARGKGFAGHLEVLPLGYDTDLFFAGDQSHDDEVMHIGLVGRMVPEKGVRDAVRVLAAIHARQPARLALVGDGPEIEPARSLAADLGVLDRLDVVPWVDTATLAGLYRQWHVVLVPSVSTSRWIEQFGRVIVEAQASGAVVGGYVSGSISEVAAGAAVLASEGDVVGLTNALVRLVDDGAHFESLRRAGLALSETRTWEVVARRHAEVLAHAVRRPQQVLPAGREQSTREFGAPASVGLQQRPFALPVLRDRPGLGRALGAVVDTAARIGPRRQRTARSWPASSARK